MCDLCESVEPPPMAFEYDAEKNEMIIRVPPRTFYLMDQILVAGVGALADPFGLAWYNREWMAKSVQCVKDEVPRDHIADAAARGYNAHIKGLAAQAGLDVELKKLDD